MQAEPDNWLEFLDEIFQLTTLLPSWLHLAIAIKRIKKILLQIENLQWKSAEDAFKDRIRVDCFVCEVQITKERIKKKKTESIATPPLPTTFLQKQFKFPP